jgi:hypothetical protein
MGEDLSDVSLVVYAASWMPIWRWLEKTAETLKARGVGVEIRNPEEAGEEVMVLPTYVVVDSGGSELARASGAQSLSDLVKLCSL